jgi:formylglycine-generating enzyme required for sulfatase activity
MAVSGYQTTAEIAGFGTVADGPAIVRQSGASWRNPGFHQDASSPVTLVSWFDAARFCNDLSAMEGFKPVYFMGIQGIGADLSRDGYRLPTEAEWEFASRGGIYSRGFRYSGSDFLDEVAWYAGNSSGAPGPRGMKYPNELGLYDMTGSVWEWCHDWYGSYPSSTQENPSGPVSGEYRIMRGGSWNSDADSCRLTNRGGGDPDSRYDVFGFRVLRRESTKGQF